MDQFKDSQERLSALWATPRGKMMIGGGLALVVILVIVLIFTVSGFEGMNCQPPNVLYTGAGGHAVCLQQRDDTGYDVPSYCQVPPLEARCDVQEAEARAVKPAVKKAESMWSEESFLSGRGDGPRYVGSTSDIQQFYAAQGLTAPLTERYETGAAQKLESTVY